MAVMEVEQVSLAKPEKIEHTDEAAKWFVLVSLVNLVVFGTFGLITAIKFVMPGLFNGVSWLAWARIRPAHVNGVVFGWLLPFSIGMFYYFIPRLCGTKLYSQTIAKISLAVWELGVVIATFFILDPVGGERNAGTLNPWLMTKGKEWEDYNAVANFLITVALLMASYVIFRTIAQRRYKQIYVAMWYAMGTLLWTALTYTIGNWPGQAVDWSAWQMLHIHPHLAFTGSNDANVNWFYGHSIVGLVATPGAIALAYYFIPKAINAPLYSHKLSIIGFWTLGGVYFWVGAHHLIYGPIPYWLQTVATIFSFLLFIPVAAAVINFLGTMRGEMHQIATNVPMKFYLAGTIMYALVSSQGSFMALRQVSGIAHFTDHTIGHSHLALFGFATMFAYGALYYAVPRMWKRPLYSEGVAEWTFWLAFVGVSVYVFAMTVSGIYQGKLWMDNPYMPFIKTIDAIRIFWHMRAGGGFLMVLSMVLALFNTYKTATSAPVEAPASEGFKAPVAAAGQA